MLHRKQLRRVLLAGMAICVVLMLLAMGMLVDQKDKQRRAHQQCEDIARAMEAYRNSPQSSRTSYQAESPISGLATLRDLATPPFGGPSFLRHGGADLIDPWGKPFQLEIRLRSDGTWFYLILTTAPDGTPITQFGIGPNSVPRPE